MRSALYYPHTKVQSEQLLKTALLFWDNLYVIVPWAGYMPVYNLPKANEAFSIIGKCHYPSQDEKRKAHEVVTEFLNRPLPPAFSYSPADSDVETYDIYSQKLLPETVEMLRRCGVSVATGPRNMRASAAAGLTLMNIIADCCAGTTLARVTDKGAAYANLAGLLLETPSTELKRDDARERLLPIPLRVVNLDPLPIDKLIDLRKREVSAPEGTQIRALRHRFVEKLELQAKQLSGAASALAQESIQKEFESDMQDDYRDLQEALKTKGGQALGSKEILTAVVAGIGAVLTGVFAPELAIKGAVPIASGLVTVGGVIAAKSKWAETRREILSKHPTAYLYEVAGGTQW